MTAGGALSDANVLLGPLPRRAGETPQTADDLLRVLDDYEIGRALVTHALAKWHDPAEGNARLAREIAGRGRLTGCWVVLPEGTGEVPPSSEQVARLLDSGARAARLCPVAHRLSLEPWEVESLLAALERQRVPLLLDGDVAHWSQARPWRFVEWACRSFPQLPVVLLREPQANLRTLFPLLDRCPNLIVETSAFQVHEGIARVVQRRGPGRLVFGTGLPEWDPALAITGLTYAGLEGGARGAVAHGTLDHLLAGAVVT